MHLYFAGLARNCATTVRQNIDSILELVHVIQPASFRFYICENDSEDRTRDEVVLASSLSPNIQLVLLDGIVHLIPDPIQRISYCRNLLLEQIKNEALALPDALYIPIDLDSSIANSIDFGQFRLALSMVALGEWNAIFPFSKPYYYDIFALRAQKWCEKNVLLNMRPRLLKGRTVSLITFFWHVSRRQHKYKSYDISPITVDSAFGGVGIYRVECILKLHYSAGTCLDSVQVCEHVDFNLGLSHKCIFPGFVVDAPLEHIRLKVLSPLALLKRFADAIYSDLTFWTRH